MLRQEDDLHRRIELLRALRQNFLRSVVRTSSMAATSQVDNAPVNVKEALDPAVLETLRVLFRALVFLWSNQLPK